MFKIGRRFFLDRKKSISRYFSHIGKCMKNEKIENFRFFSILKIFIFIQFSMKISEIFDLEIFDLEILKIFRLDIFRNFKMT